MGNNVVVPDRQSFETMEQVRLDATVQTILQQGNVNFKDNVTTISDLPSTGNTLNDFRMVIENGWVYKWNGSSWVQVAVSGGGSGVQSVSPGVGITITGTATDPIINMTNPTPVASVTGGTGISVDNTDPDNPVVTNTAPDQVVALTDGTGIDVTGTYPNFTIDSTITQYTDELAQDAVGNILTDTDTINFTYNDGTPSIVADVRAQMSITSDASGLKLNGDETSPGNNQVYGTDGSGVKGWKADPSGGGTAVLNTNYTTNLGGSIIWVSVDSVNSSVIDTTGAFIFANIIWLIDRQNITDNISISLTNNGGTNWVYNASSGLSNGSIFIGTLENPSLEAGPLSVNLEFTFTAGAYSTTHNVIFNQEGL